MQLDSILQKFNFPNSILEIYAQANIKKLYPPQAEAINKGLFQDKNILLSVPTAAGKTLIAELCMLKSIISNHGRALYIVPLKALANEKYQDFKAKFLKAGIKVGIATGDSDTYNKSFDQYQILIATAEKIDALLRIKTPWLLNNLSVVVLDEIHFLNDGARGPTLEILAARIKQINKKVQILALSATISNADEIAGWLEAEVIKSNWRPIPLKEGVYFNGNITFKDHAKTKIPSSFQGIKTSYRIDDLSRLAANTIFQKGQVLIFVNSRRSAQAVSKQISKTISLTLDNYEKEKLHMISKEIVSNEASSTKICQKLSQVISKGVAFHHAGLKPSQRNLIESSFKNNLIKVICSTPTLAAGVNLPARSTILRDFKRFESGLGSSFIPVSEYKQCAGRAGRPQYDKYGESIIISKSLSELKVLINRYINSDPEPVTSKLGKKAALRVHILSSIAGGYVHDINDTFNFISNTFLAYQKKTPNLIELISEIFDFLHKEDFIKKNGFSFYATPFGQCTSQLYLDPLSSIVIRQGFKNIKDRKKQSVTSYLHLFNCCPDALLLKSTSKLESIEAFALENEDELLISSNDFPRLDNFFLYMSIIKTSMMLAEWINEAKEDAICDQFNIGPGDIYRHIESMRWLLHAGTVFADLFNLKEITFPLSYLKDRIKYGIKEELIPLTKLKGIGRIRARSLFDSGYTSISNIKHTDVGELSRIKNIGTNVAENILKQIKSY